MSNQKPEYIAYWLALGRFVDSFSKVEAALSTILMLEAGVTIDVARSIFSGARIDIAKDFIRRIRQSKKLGEDPQLERIFLQLNIITKARNDILHLGASFDGSDFWVSNEARAHIPENIRRVLANPDILQKMTDDLSVIYEGLASYVMKKIRQNPNAISVGQIAETINQIEAAVRAPWQYTP